MTAPKLRFKEFDGDWTKYKIAEVTEYLVDGTHFSPKSTDGEFKYITSKNIRNDGLDLTNISYISKDEHESIYKRCKVQLGDILLTKDGANTGNCCLNTLDEEFSLLSSVAVLRGKNQSFDNNFILQILQSDLGQNMIVSSMSGQAITRITLTKLKDYSFHFPEFKEQTKIASFLSEVDKKISQLTQKHQLLSQYKQGMMQKLFSQQTRFKADDGSEFGEWEEKPLNYFLYTSKLKNKNLKYSKNEVLSVSGEIGIVNQIELLGRSYAGVSVAPYGVVEHGDIVYTKSPLKSNPYGIIKANKGKSGIVSTLYAIYKCRENIIPNLVDYYFQNDMKLNHFLKPLVKKGAKNDMKVNNDHVLTGLVCFPSSIEEQTKIVNFLSTIDQKIDVVSEQLEQAKLWKKGLLQQMFV